MGGSRIGWGVVLDLTLFRLESDKKPRLFLKNEQCVDKHLPHQREMFIDTLRGR